MIQAWRLGVSCATVMLVALVGLSPARADAATDNAVAASCQSVRVPVTISGAPGASLYGELCRPPGATPSTVQVLVHGGTYNHEYWDWPLDAARYSYVQDAVRAGYATFNFDRLGYGGATHPPSTVLTVENQTRAIHQVIQRLRSGAIAGPGFRRVVWVGHSLGSFYGWLEASMFGDVDAFVLTGVTHAIDPAWNQMALDSMYPASLDPKFAGMGLDDGYLTTQPGKRGMMFYYAPTAEPRVIALDEQLKELLSATEITGAVPYFSGPPAEGAPSRAIRVPTLLVMGGQDAAFCKPPDGTRCTTAWVRAREAPYYSPEARLEVTVVSGTGHDLQLHQTAPATSAVILGWLARHR